MKDFFKYVLATVVGIIVAGVVIMFLGVLTVFGLASSSDKDVTIDDNSVLRLELNGIISERAPESSPLDFLSSMNPMGSTDTMGLDDILSAIKKAKDNDNIKGIYLLAGTLDAQPASVEAIHNALVSFKESGKFIIAYGDNYEQLQYYLASTADKVLINPQGSLDWHGLAGINMFYKDLMDKLGIEVQIFKVGTFKSAVEPFMLTSMSDANREQVAAYLGSIWQKFSDDVATSRNISKEALEKIADEGAMFKSGQELIAAGLVDSLIYKNDVRAYLNRYMGLEEDKKVSSYSVADMRGVKRNTPRDKSGNIVAVYYAVGEIDGTTALLSSSDEGINSEKVIKDLRKLKDDDDVKAVVFRINSGGGSAVASEQIRHAVKLLKAKKPVVVSMGGAAASGGYWISSPANYIFAEPTTITGSIGIFGLIPNFSGLVTDKLGITFDGVTTNKFSDAEMNLVLAKDNAEEMKYLQGHVDRGYISFLNIVSEGRGMKPAQVDSIAQGRVWLATDAVKIKLVDKLGSLDDAVKKAAELAKVSDYYTTTYPGESSWMDTFFPKEKKGSYLDGELRMLLGELYEPLMEIRKTIKDGSRIQARMLDDIRVK